MEFLLISGGLSFRAAAIKHACEKAKRLASVDGSFQYSHFDGLFIAGAKPIENNQERFYWDGHGMDGGAVFSSGTKLKPNARKLSAYHSASISGGDSAYQQMRGVFASVCVNVETAQFSVVVDPLSQYSLFIWKYKGSLCVSTSIYLIEAVATSVGESLTRNPYVGCFEVACGTGAGRQSGYHNVSVQPFEEVIVGQGAEWSFQASLLQVIPKRAGYDELLQLSAERLTSYASALDKAFPENGIIYDLTGGQDSRICFAAAVGAGVKTPNFFVGGKEQDPDKFVARRLAITFGAKEGKLPQAFTENTFRPDELARRAVFRQQGHSTLHHYALGRGRLDTVARVRGGAGELSRSHMKAVDKGCFFSGQPVAPLQALLKGDRIYKQAVSSYWLGVADAKKRMASRWAYKLSTSLRGQRTLYTKAFQNHAVKTLVSEHYNSAISMESMGVDTYLSDRARRHFGFLSRTLNLSYGAFEPLYDPVLMAAARALPWEERADGRFVFDLMEKMAGKDILKVPFAAKSINHRGRLHLAQRLSCTPEDTVDMCVSMPQVDRIDMRSGFNLNLWENYQGPENLSAHGKYVWQNQGYMKELAEGLSDDHEFWALVNREQFLQVLSRGYFFETTQRATHGLRFLHTLVWLMGDESAVGTEKTV